MKTWNLKPPPFCGKEARLLLVGHRTYKVMCISCLAQTNACFGEQTAVYNWNRRASDE